ncbi:MAG: methionine gamma-lyase family protein [Christensenellaceae bacterium]|jgi:cystathionine beta-lyase family protein involved in aluminum resistance|nr:methionine gamma-lyase family protein [Christensenellaceae bacterium]
MNIKPIITKAEQKIQPRFKALEDTALFNQHKVLSALKNNRVALRHFAGTTGYGYDDAGRDNLFKVYSEVFGAEAAIVSYNITCGSHALKVALYGILRPGDTMLAITGKPYDTMDITIFGDGDKDNGSLKDFGVMYKQIDLKDGKFDEKAILEEVAKNPKIIFLQRSKGYSLRDALSIEQIEDIIKKIRTVNKTGFIFVDNCYCEFVDMREPCEVGADIAVGSLIKNPGGGIVPTGGYIVGTQRAIALIATSHTSPSLGLEVGSNEQGYRLLYQGLFMAPHIVLQSLKGGLLIAQTMEDLGFEVFPKAQEPMYDIVRDIKFKTKQELVNFCVGIQHASPVDSFVDPEPWDMPGYIDQVIMAAGTFVQGASIELSCDAPIREPYILYLQGGLTYEHVKLALNEAIGNLRK